MWLYWIVLISQFNSVTNELSEENISSENSLLYDIVIWYWIINFDGTGRKRVRWDNVRCAFINPSRETSGIHRRNLVIMSQDRMMEVQRFMRYSIVPYHHIRERMPRRVRQVSPQRFACLLSGEAMEQGLRDCCRSIRIGKILIQSDEETQKAKVYYAKFPPDIYRRKVLLMYPILSKWWEVQAVHSLWPLACVDDDSKVVDYPVWQNF